MCPRCNRAHSRRANRPPARRCTPQANRRCSRRSSRRRVLRWSRQVRRSAHCCCFFPRRLLSILRVGLNPCYTRTHTTPCSALLCNLRAYLFGSSSATVGTPIAATDRATVRPTARSPDLPADRCALDATELTAVAPTDLPPVVAPHRPTVDASDEGSDRCVELCGVLVFSSFSVACVSASICATRAILLYSALQSAPLPLWIE